MAKVLKIVGEVVIGGALAFTGIGLAVGLPFAAATSFGIGVSASTLFLAGAGLTIAGGLLAKKPQVSPSQVQRTQVSLALDEPRKIVFGRTAQTADVRYE